MPAATAAQAASADPAARLAARYAVALACARLGEHERAAQAVRQLLAELRPDFPAVAQPPVREQAQRAALLLHAEVALAARQPQEALRVLAGARVASPAARSVLLLHAQAVREAAQGEGGVHG